MNKTIKENPQDIVMRLRNLKAAGTKSFNIPTDKHLIAFKGNNKTGKTTILKTILGCYRGEAYGDDVITHGENDAFVSLEHMPGPDGVKYTLHMEATKKKIKFEAINEETGEKIKKVTEMRKFFNVSEMTIEDFFFKAQSAKGKKEIIEIIKTIVKKKDPKKYEEIEVIEEKIKPRTGELYLNQSDAIKNFDKLKLLEPDPLTEDEKSILNYDTVIIENHKKFIEREKNLKKALNEFTEIKNLAKDLKVEKDTEIHSLEMLMQKSDMKIEAIDEKKEQIKKLQAEINDLEEENEATLKSIKEKEEYIKNNIDAKIEELRPKYDEAKKAVEENDFDTEEIREEHQESIENYDDLIEVQKKVKEKEKWKEDFQKALSKKNEAEMNLRNARMDLKNIYASIDLPFDFIIEDDDIFINGLTISDANQSRAEMKIIATLIMIYHNNAPVIVMGELSDFDQKHLNILINILKKSGYLMFADEVVREPQDMKVVYYENIENE